MIIYHHDRFRGLGEASNAEVSLMYRGKALVYVAWVRDARSGEWCPGSVSWPGRHSRVSSYAGTPEQKRDIRRYRAEVKALQDAIGYALKISKMKPEKVPKNTKDL